MTACNYCEKWTHPYKDPTTTTPQDPTSQTHHNNFKPPICESCTQATGNLDLRALQSHLSRLAIANKISNIFRFAHDRYFTFEVTPPQSPQLPTNQTSTDSPQSPISQTTQISTPIPKDHSNHSTQRCQFCHFHKPLPLNSLQPICGTCFYMKGTLSDQDYITTALKMYYTIGNPYLGPQECFEPRRKITSNAKMEQLLQHHDCNNCMTIRKMGPEHHQQQQSTSTPVLPVIKHCKSCGILKSVPEEIPQDRSICYRCKHRSKIVL